MRYKLTYIYHDCFLLEMQDMAVLFDYFADSEQMACDVKERRKRKEELPDFLKHLNNDINLYVVVSHHHKDHFSSAIFEWSKFFCNIHYIISEDVAKFPFSFRKCDKESRCSSVSNSADIVAVLRPGEEYADERLQIKAFPSTDIGNSYMLTIAGKKFFHAGDLNLWQWHDDTQAEITAAQNAYFPIVEHISQQTEEIELCMFPVDSRLGGDYAQGARIFLENLHIRHFVPMHFCLADNQKDVASRREDAFKIENYAASSDAEIICLGERGDCFSASAF